MLSKDIWVDVGGKKFHTTRKTVMKSTFLCDIINSDNNDSIIGLEECPYFIDRNPEDFSLILDYLREGSFNNRYGPTLDHRRRLAKSYGVTLGLCDEPDKMIGIVVLIIFMAMLLWCIFYYFLINGVNERSQLMLDALFSGNF